VRPYRAGASWALLAALVACSGKSGRSDNSPPDGAQAREAGAGGHGSEVGGNGGAAPGASGAAAGAPAAAGDAGAAGAAGETFSASPTVLCEDDRDCTAGATCTSMQYAQQRACLRPCDADSACAGEAECVTLGGRALGCMPHCEWPWDCALNFDCIKHAPSESYVCAPVQWAVFILNQ
jgi:hypothetical protein